ncbi:uncharacterized protein LOC141600798 [Silene latifolia]|uniref:uncharacterized protein LOC141600798 n=1 Tax=Silene latifolia TaxID=37657 RepID=UPI003D773FC9
MRADGATLDKTCLGYARLMVEVQVGQEFPDKIYFKDEKGQEICVCVEYEWKPVVCGSLAASPPKNPIPGVTPKTPPFGGPTRHDSSILPTPASPIIQLARQEHNVSFHLKLGISYLEATSPDKDKDKSEMQNKVGLFGLVEIKIKDNDFQSVLNNLGNYWHGKEISSGGIFWYTVVYGSNFDSDRERLWMQLNHLKDLCTKPWCIYGDFNALLNYNERLGSEVSWNEIRDFRQCVDYCEVTDINAQGSFFTWSNKQPPATRVFSTIDRCLINIDWMALYPDCNAYFMNKGNFEKE